MSGEDTESTPPPSQHKSLTQTNGAETSKKSQGNQAKSNAVQEAKRVIAEAKKDDKR